MASTQIVKATGTNGKTTAIFDENNNLLTAVTKGYVFPDARERVDQTYDKNGNLLTSRYKTVDQIYKIKNIYDTDNNLLKSTEKRDEDVDGTTDSLKQLELTYDKDGKLLASKNTVSFDGFGQTAQTTYIYADNASSQITQNPQCIRDSLFSGLGASFVYNQAFPNMSCLWTFPVTKEITEIAELNGQNDGEVHERSQTKYFYDGRGRLVKSVFEKDFGESGPDGNADYIVREVYQYDRNDNLLRSRSKADEDADGLIDSIRTDTYTYDRQARITKFKSNYSDFVERNKQTYTYGRNNRILEYKNVTDFGSFDSKTKETYEYLRQEEVLGFESLSQSVADTSAPIVCSL